jgi:hypothetical protein
MKILAGIPTRLRSGSGPLAEILARVCDEVLVVSQGATVKIQSEVNNINIIERDIDIGMKAARNTIFQYALDNGYDYCLQSDDDLKYSEAVVRNLIRIIANEPSLASISSCPRVYHNWEKDIVSSKDFTIFQCPTQLWIIRMEAIKEAGMLNIDVLEDIELGLRMWQFGWVLGKVHMTQDLTHNPVISRMGKGDNSGGQPESLRKFMMPASCEYIYRHNSNLLRFFRTAREGSNRTYNAAYNWDAMCEKAKARWDTIGYQDSKGRFI